MRYRILPINELHFYFGKQVYIPIFQITSFIESPRVLKDGRNSYLVSPISFYKCAACFKRLQWGQMKTWFRLETLQENILNLLLDFKKIQIQVVYTKIVLPRRGKSGEYKVQLNTVSHPSPDFISSLSHKVLWSIFVYYQLLT